MNNNWEYLKETFRKYCDLFVNKDHKVGDLEIIIQKKYFSFCDNDSETWNVICNGFRHNVQTWANTEEEAIRQAINDIELLIEEEYLK